MSKQNKILFTKAGLSDLKKEYETLLNKKRPELVERLAQARDLGDLTENTQYTSARQDLTFLDGRISELEDILHQAKLIKSKASKQSIDIGSKVTIHIRGQKATYTIVGEWEADPLAKKISHMSPLGKALIGKRVGGKVEVEAPAGKLIYTVLKIG